MSILNVDKIQPIGSGSTVTVNATDTILTNAQAGVITATTFSGNLTGTINTAAQGNITSLGTLSGLVIDNNTNTSMSSGSAGQLVVGGDGYTGAIALDADAMHIYHNSSSRALVFGTNETERLRITGAGNIGIGTATADKSLTIGGTTPVLKLNDANGRILELRGGSTSHNPSLLTQYASLLYLGSNGTESVSIGQEHLTITNGNLIIGTGGHGIDFSSQTGTSATGAATGSSPAEVLDHYEEGSWTPKLMHYNGSWGDCTLDTAGTITKAHYTKIGRMVTATFDWDGFKINSGTLSYPQIGGLPFNTDSSGLGVSSFATCLSQEQDQGLWVASTNNVAQFYRNGLSWNSWTSTTNSRLQVTLHYQTA